ncbi:SurA N-terminal domain-containing protein, partial [Treponema sp. OttesenSCG-928-L16]|nr:SurA N-terminal domain-containing protein [Treponema sp. OttesenSCG-928-L16]
MKRLLFFISIMALAGGALYSQSDLQPAAIVNLTKSEAITVKQFRTEVETMEKASGRTLNAAERKQVLDVMINERLALQAAERDRVTISDGEVNQQMQQLRSSMVQQLGRQPTDAEFALAVKNETGLEVNAFRDQMKRQLTIQKYLM